MRKTLVILTVVLTLCLTLGCGSDKEKGQNRDKDKPRTAEPAAAKTRLIEIRDPLIDIDVDGMIRLRQVAGLE